SNYLKSVNYLSYDWGTLKLKKALLEKGITVRETKADMEINLAVDAAKVGKEAYSIITDGKRITVMGGDERGMIYGSLSLVEDLGNGISLRNIKASSEKPNLPFRAIKFDLPWDTYRRSYALDLHVQTCKDLNYWEAFLDMMSSNRFNALTLWNLHPYTYMIKAKNFPEASPFSENELKDWQNLFHGIFRMAKERAIEIYIVPFNIFVSPAFAKAHNVATDNLDHDYFFGKADTSEIVKRYTKESVTQLLQEYPEITGMGLTHGEYMGGMIPKEREDWINETIIKGMQQAKRKLKLVHRIPLSANTGSGGSTSIETERLTRNVIEAEGKLEFIEAPIWADLKFNWSHAHSTPKLVKVHGGKMYDALFNPPPKNYKITWTARNEDFFCLRWGVPDFVRKHIALNTPTYVGGYFLGSETYIPAKDYFTKTGTTVDWKYAFERQWLFYKIWGRLLYNPGTPDEKFQGEFTRRYGKQAQNLLQASALAGTTPLRLGSAFDFTWDFALYSEGFMALDSKVKRVEYISVQRLMQQAATDPDYVSVSEYAKASSAGGSFDNIRITPPVLIRMLEQDCNKALDLVKNIQTSHNNSLMYEVADIKAWANLGLHFAEKLKGAVALQTYQIKGGEENKQNAVQHLQGALKYWDVVISITRPIYNDMPLVHYSEENGRPWRENDHLRFHWEKIRPDVAKDVEYAKNATFATTLPGSKN
ncbi:MAG: glycoside hydrolase family 20 zincin-like fold domain-containing protein, partial [Chitinophagaceae bacterium]